MSDEEVGNAWLANCCSNSILFLIDKTRNVSLEQFGVSNLQSAICGQQFRDTHCNGGLEGNVSCFIHQKRNWNTRQPSVPNSSDMELFPLEISRGKAKNLKESCSNFFSLSYGHFWGIGKMLFKRCQRDKYSLGSARTTSYLFPQNDPNLS